MRTHIQALFTPLFATIQPLLCLGLVAVDVTEESGDSGRFACLLPVFAYLSAVSSAYVFEHFLCTRRGERAQSSVVRAPRCERVYLLTPREPQRINQVS